MLEVIIDPHMIRVVVALGGNLERPERTFQLAIDRLKGLGEEFRVSKFYWTKPVSTQDQPDFLNGVCCFKTADAPDLLFSKLEGIECELGKVKKDREAPRVIDLDLLFYGSQVYEDQVLRIPHPRWKERLFVLVPLLDLFQEIEVAGNRWNIKNLIEEMNEKRTS